MLVVPAFLRELLPIVLLLLAIALVVMNLPKVNLGHSDAFKVRRRWNWIPLGLTYAFLYMGRYNLNEATSALKGTSNADFGVIFGIGTAVYGVSFLLNGPLTDLWGGRTTILISAMGAAVANVLMGAVVYGVLKFQWTPPGGLVTTLSVLYAVNMYFQSFGAVSIVKVNSAWFHLKERGILGGVFGILISLGIYFAYDWSKFIVRSAPTYWVFFIPALILVAFFVADWVWVRDLPSQAGFSDFDPQDASSHDTTHLGPGQVFLKMMKNPVILTILAIEFCSGFLRNAIMQWGPKFAKQTGLTSFVFSNWGLILCVAGILGGMFAGIISDKVFDSRRGPVSSVLYAGMAVGSVGAFFLLGDGALGWVVAFMSLCVIGVHGMLSGTASMDFGGKKNAGIAVGIIDGAVYAGTAFQSLLLGNILPSGDAAKLPSNWLNWPLAMIPLSVLGLYLASRVWHATPRPRTETVEETTKPQATVPVKVT